MIRGLSQLPADPVFLYHPTVTMTAHGSQGPHGKPQACILFQVGSGAPFPTGRAIGSIWLRPFRSLDDDLTWRTFFRRCQQRLVGWWHSPRGASGGAVSHGGNPREEVRQGALVIGSPFSARMLAILKAGSLREMEQSVVLRLFFA